LTPWHRPFREYWEALTRRGDPIKLGNLARMSFEAGWRARNGEGMREVVADQVGETKDWNDYEYGDVLPDGSIKCEGPINYRSGVSTGQVWIMQSQQSLAEKHGWELVEDCGIVNGNHLVKMQR